MRGAGHQNGADADILAAEGVISSSRWSGSTRASTSRAGNLGDGHGGAVGGECPGPVGPVERQLGRGLRGSWA